ncbi:hypothetical protein SISSUDRAFT_841167 [Sistotremastrum suecicum HHB10207 ss-3]|uniref:DUF6593 domain-containing protein n=1 Tax=Sistotremastrum suecicum HHB10207 ss-3 TaxID=1314776 RepID=A0A166CJQ2_9AGAM|nr:hypothetical protein SISSUDRAFT_841167 [Sistotremastrum suecicum HHB10207 ss-3]
MATSLSAASDGDLIHSEYIDEDGMTAFRVTLNSTDTNGITVITRDQRWAQMHPEASRGPSDAFLYWGPAAPSASHAHGRMNGFAHIGKASPKQAMGDFLRIKKQGSPLSYLDRSRYFEGQDGKKYKWKRVGTKLHCMDTRKNIIATYDPEPSASPTSSSGTSPRSNLPSSTSTSNPTLSKDSTKSNWGQYHIFTSTTGPWGVGARLSMTDAGVQMAIEVVTTLVLNRMANALIGAHGNGHGHGGR